MVQWVYPASRLQKGEAGPRAQTSLGASWWHRLLFHHNSRAATRQARRRPIAKMQKTPAKLCSLRDLPSAWALAWLMRSQRPMCGHHFCLSTSRSPVSCSSRILQNTIHMSHKCWPHQYTMKVLAPSPSCWPHCRQHGTIEAALCLSFSPPNPFSSLQAESLSQIHIQFCHSPSQKP